MKETCLLILFIFFYGSSNAQKSDWGVLSQVVYQEVMDTAENRQIINLQLSKKLQAIVGQEVKIVGYVSCYPPYELITLDQYSTEGFCSQTPSIELKPEQSIKLKLKSNKKFVFRRDKKMLIKGILKVDTQNGLLYTIEVTDWKQKKK